MKPAEAPTSQKSNSVHAMRRPRLLTCLLLLALCGALVYLADVITAPPRVPGGSQRHVVVVEDYYDSPLLLAKPTAASVPHLPFVPRRGHQCTDMFTESGHNFTYSEFYWEHADAYSSALTSLGIRREGQADELSWLLAELAALPWVETVCETGLRAGHAAFFALTAKPENVLYSFEANRFNFTDDVVTFMSSEFPDRFYFFPGDTASTIPKFHEKNNDTRCDLMFVDPTRKTGAQIEQDLDNFKMIRHPKDNLVVAISYRSGERGDMGSVWRQKVASGAVLELFSCAFPPGVPGVRPDMARFYEVFRRNDMEVAGLHVGSFSKT